ncbi:MULTISPECIES: MerR family transcriptional regulator [Cellulosimicrobium]|uniref:MerR family transcriptional regulator n=1 Tax=Cellulosimicrobium TaxID=157920 RepID=UPI001BAB494E|nr:MerR family transcriptional regulator [Cellulosimicrobium cellulans]QUC01952.1 MerR family transcriptional regulator [Cellulosimicrobium cellulans]
MTDPGEPATLHIGAVAARTGLSLRTLRHYDEVGLVPPSARSDGGFRLYTEKDVQRLLVVRRMKPLGFTLEEMADLLEISDRLASGDNDAQLPRRLTTYLDVAEQRRADLAAKLAMADEFITMLKSR